MKNILKLTYLLLFAINISCKAQTVPLNSVDYPDGAYLKDLDNILPFWVGTWKGVVNNKEYTFQFIKLTKHQTTFFDGSYEYEDMLKGKLKVIDLSTNQILYNDLFTSAFSDYKIQLNGKLETEYFFMFFDSEDNCSNKFKFSLIKDSTNLNQVLYKNFGLDEYESWNCPFSNQSEIPMYLPQVNMVLTRQ